MIAQQNGTTIAPKSLTPTQALDAAVLTAQGSLDKRLHDSLSRACALVKHGGVTQNEAGQWYAKRETDPTPCPVNGECRCPQAKTAVQHLCEHRLAVGLAKLRDKYLVEGLPDPKVVLEPVTSKEEDLQEETVDTATGEILKEERLDDDILDPDEDEWQREEAAEVTIPQRFLTYIHGKAFVQYEGLLAMAQEKGLRSLRVIFTHVDAHMALAQADLLMADGSEYTDVADATPDNVPPHIKPHYPRMAATRAKARVLRMALDIGMCSVEEVAIEPDESQPQDPPPPSGEHWCTIHNTKLYENQSKREGGGTYYSHKKDGGGLCYGK